MSPKDNPDVSAIRAIIDRQFRSLCWSEGREADWSAFASDFHSTATLYPAARPARDQTVDAFVERMKGLADSSLRSFKERMLGADVRVFGNIAVAIAACEMTENDEEVSRGVEAMLLIKEDDEWKIVSQSWDMQSDEKPIPSYLLAQDRL
jgi:hypothetical protein